MAARVGYGRKGERGMKEEPVGLSDLELLRFHVEKALGLLLRLEKAKEKPKKYVVAGTPTNGEFATLPEALAEILADDVRRGSPGFTWSIRRKD